jgi:hypothetical protein
VPAAIRATPTIAKITSLPEAFFIRGFAAPTGGRFWGMWPFIILTHGGGKEFLLGRSRPKRAWPCEVRFAGKRRGIGKPFIRRTWQTSLIRIVKR